jgi:hexosaminidase
MLLRLLFLLTPLGLFAQNAPLLPMPQQVAWGAGEFVVEKGIRFLTPPGYLSLLQKKLERTTSNTSATSGKVIEYQLLDDKNIPEEGYRLRVAPSFIKVWASTPKGLFYAEQTLLQLLEISSTPISQRLPSVSIEDAPRFAWRGMHLDESRHFFGKTFVKKYIDYLAALKMNVFHWHLTDAPGWRIEIKKYPRLTEVGAWRPDRSGILFNDADTARTGEAMTYGGFYTREDIREMVAYAAERHITIIPEIEMPGHSTAALVAYPEFSCSGGPFPMPGGAKNSPYPNFCVSNPASMDFLKNTLLEVMDLFPSKYIHIGGDEVERSQWRHCKRCQAYMAAEGISDEAALQVNFTQRIETFLRSQGRQLMGWDEIMEGGNLTPDAGVMVWRGEPLVQQATQAGHPVVVTHNYYFDLYQGNPQYEPITYGYKPLEQVYQYEPVPDTLSAEQKTKILGVQGCMWSENLYNAGDVEYMLFPRLFALAEVAWTQPRRKDWAGFQLRLPWYLNWLEGRNTRYATSVYNPIPVMRRDSASGVLECRFEQQIKKYRIHYTLDGSTPDRESKVYHRPVPLYKAAEIRAAAFDGAQKVSPVMAMSYQPSKATGRPFILLYPPTQYNAGRPEALCDGIRGVEAFHDGNWCGFYGQDLHWTVDLGSDTLVQQVSVRLLEANQSWIYLPLQLTISISSDGSTFETVYTADQRTLTVLDRGRIKTANTGILNKKARYVRIVAQNPGAHPVYAEGKCWLFFDEIEIR